MLPSLVLPRERLGVQSPSRRRPRAKAKHLFFGALSQRKLQLRTEALGVFLGVQRRLSART